MMAYYALSVFLSAFLLFQVQPLIGKYILPWFGGAWSVWSVAMLFFQVLLVAGNSYAYGLIRQIGPRKQGVVHLALLGVSLAVLLAVGLAWGWPILPGVDWKPQGDTVPTWHILAILTVSVGLPYLVLSTNSPLMQAWFHRHQPEQSPYRLYALSNVGSLLGLVTYPFLVEPLLSLRAQAALWVGGYVVFAACAGYGALRVVRQRVPGGKATAPPGSGVRSAVRKGARPTVGMLLLWTAFAACASVVMLSTTNHVSQEVSVVPFLWVLMLALYLASFILAFSGKRWYSRTWYTVAFFAATALFCWFFYARPAGLGIWAPLGVYALVVFVACMVCHGELAALRPAPRYLTLFYLLVSAGGALGGIAVNLIAPGLFTGLWELPVGLIGCWVLLFIAYARGWQRDRARRGSWLTDALLVSGIGMLGVTLFLYVQNGSADVLSASRNFYGVLRVRARGSDDPSRQGYELFHGATRHGFQYLGEEERRLPTAYYTEESGVGLAILHHPRYDAGLRVGVVGLGVGTLATYGRPGDAFRFYEINPDVIKLAEGEGGFFTYLEDSPARVEIVPGDARVSMERELAAGGSQGFDLLVVDAFSDGTIPVHLLTQEAFDLYLRHLRPDGIIALHISNVYLDLRPAVRALANSFQLGSAFIHDEGDGGRISSSDWMLVTRSEAFLARSEIASRSTPLPAYGGFRLWTDDYSNLFQVLIWR